VDKCRVGRPVLTAVGPVLIAPRGAVGTVPSAPGGSVNTALAVPMAAIPGSEYRVGRMSGTSVG
jgi:hypothetical protein